MIIYLLYQDSNIFLFLLIGKQFNFFSLFFNVIVDSHTLIKNNREIPHTLNPFFPNGSVLFYYSTISP